MKKDYDVCGCDRGVRWRKIISVAKLAFREWCSLPLGTVGLIEVTGVGSGLPNRHSLWKNLPSSCTRMEKGGHLAVIATFGCPAWFTVNKEPAVGVVCLGLFQFKILVQGSVSTCRGCCRNRMRGLTTSTPIR